VVVEETLKTYHGLILGDNKTVSVRVRTNGGDSRHLAHHVRHSPDGFSWGYGGSGPAELARCILLDAFGVLSCPDSPNDCQCENRWVDSSYQSFKAETIADLDRDKEWKLGQLDILDWVFDWFHSEELAAVPS
jgi:hypothetical protein